MVTQSGRSHEESRRSKGEQRKGPRATMAPRGIQKGTISGDNPTSGPVRCCTVSVHRRVVSSHFPKLEKKQIFINLFFFKFAKIAPNNTPVHRKKGAPVRPGCGVVSRNGALLVPGVEPASEVHTRIRSKANIDNVDKESIC